MIDCTQLREYVVRPALQLINLYSEGAEELLIATCAQESMGGRYLKQINGPALGIYQMEPSTHDYIWKTHLVNKDFQGRELNSIGYCVLKGCRFVISPPAEVMVHNLYYATMIARCFWLSVPDAMPDRDDLNGIWDLYKIYWNTMDGKATRKEFFTNYCNYTGTKSFSQ